MLRWGLSRGERNRQRKRREWEAQGRPLPAPSVVKHAIIRWYAERYALDTFVETGTFMGGTVAAVQDVFDTIYSIELDEALYRRAAARFRRSRHVTILHGDSAAVLPGVLARLRAPALFWLDAHYSGRLTARGAVDTPIAHEIGAVVAHPVEGHVVLVDDAREFGTTRDYPTFDELRVLVQARDPGLVIEVGHDVIRIHRGQD